MTEENKPAGGSAGQEDCHIAGDLPAGSKPRCADGCDYSLPGAVPADGIAFGPVLAYCRRCEGLNPRLSNPHDHAVIALSETLRAHMLGPLPPRPVVYSGLTSEPMPVPRHPEVVDESTRARLRLPPLLIEATDAIDEARARMWREFHASDRDALRDNAAVDRFAAVMKARLAEKRAEGRGGWWMCEPAKLWEMLAGQVMKFDAVGVGNYAMMLYLTDSQSPSRRVVMTRYRRHSGGLAESMDTVILVGDFVDLCRVIADDFAKLGETMGRVEVVRYGFDARIGWDTHLVCVDGAVVGYADGPLAL
jgi:hypothetical protein